MRVAQHVTFTWELSADEDAMVCAALQLYAVQEPRAGVLLKARGAPGAIDPEKLAATLAALESGKIEINGVPLRRTLPDVDLLADEIVEERR